MISTIQTNIPVGMPNLLQEQANASQVQNDVRTNNAEQLSGRNVEQAAAGSGVAVLGQKRPSEEEQRNRPPEKKPEEPREKPEIVPPPPSRFQVRMAEQQKQLIQTQRAVGEYLLMAAIGGGVPAEPEDPTQRPGMLNKSEHTPPLPGLTTLDLEV